MSKTIEYAEFVGVNEPTKKWLENNPVPEEYTTQEYEHILDFLKSKNFDSLDWASWSLLKEKTRKWDRMLQSNVATIDEEYGIDVETVLDFQDGFKFVKLVSQKAYFREGSLMKHCVSSYFDREATIYSLRDSWNRPHCTIQEDMQIRGKADGPISHKYIDYVVQFLEWTGMKVRDEEMENLGYQVVPFLDYVTNKEELYRRRYATTQQVQVANYGDYVITTNIEDLKNPGKWLFFGSISIRDEVVTLYPESVSGGVSAYGSSSLSLPLVDSVGGSVETYGNSSLSLPLVTSVERNVLTHDSSSLSAPILTSVGWTVATHGNSSLSLPIVDSVGWTVATFDNSSLSLPLVDSVKGDIIIKGNSSLSAPLLT